MKYEWVRKGKDPKRKKLGERLSVFRQATKDGTYLSNADLEKTIRPEEEVVVLTVAGLGACFKRSARDLVGSSATLLWASDVFLPCTSVSSLAFFLACSSCNNCSFAFSSASFLALSWAWMRSSAACRNLAPASWLLDSVLAGTADGARVAEVVAVVFLGAVLVKSITLPSLSCFGVKKSPTAETNTSNRVERCETSAKRGTLVHGTRDVP